MGEVTTKKRQRRPAPTGDPGATGTSARKGDTLQDPLDGTVQMLADPLAEGGAGDVVQMDAKNGKVAAADTVLSMTGATPNANAVTSFAAELLKLSEGLKKAGIDRFSPDDRDQLGAASTLLDWSGKTTKLGNAVTNWVEKAIDMRKRSTLSDPMQDTDRAGGAAKALGHAKTVVDVARLFAKLNSSKTMKAVQDDFEDKDKRDAWAKEVTETFDLLGTIIPDSIADTPMATPLRMFKGYLSAPKAYLAAFQAVLNAHIGKLDEAARLKYQTKLLSGGEVVWGGPLTMLYFKSGAAKPRGLDTFMAKAHKRMLTEKKINIWNASREVGITLLASEIETRVSDPDKKASWIAYINDPDSHR